MVTFHSKRVTFLFIGAVSLCLSGSVAIAASDDEGDDSSSYYCEDPNTSPSKLAPGFHKICPETTEETLGQPICGDGSNFSFSFTSPSQRKANSNKIIIEFQGGGACWDDNSCNQAGDRLSYPEAFDNFLGLSCSAAQYGSGGNFDGYPINFLCDTTIGETDLSTYNYILVPYCTQDVHLGDSEAEYEEGSVVYHHGAHNMNSVLQWVYKHFPNPSHILLTGCSAGGSPLPVVYDLMYHHYNSFLKGGPGRSVNINTLMDSAVYLTPTYFINNGMTNWNVNTILSQTRFDFDQEASVQYSTRMWEHVLKRGSNKDKWGFLSHTTDNVSLAYWQAMGAGYYGNDDQNGDGEGGNDCDSWYSDMDASLSSVQSVAKNADTFWIDGGGHCSLGLYYGLQEDGFDEWAGEIVKEQTLPLSKRSNESVPMFLMSLAVGAAVMFGALISKVKTRTTGATDEGRDNTLLHNGDADSYVGGKQRSAIVVQKVAQVLSPLAPLGAKFQNCPVTTFYYLVSTIYFVCMLLNGGITHPLNNPSLGPSATDMSKFGINNPTLIVDQKQTIRLFVSGFLSSGLLTFAMVTICVFKVMRHTERAFDFFPGFVFASGCIMVGSNLVYTCFGNGASCGSLAFVLGMNVLSMRLKSGAPMGTELQELNRPICTTTFFTLWGVTLFPFNSWIMILAAMVIGALVPLAITPGKGKSDGNDGDSLAASGGAGTESLTMANTFSSSQKLYLKKIATVVGAVFFLVYILILSGLPNPNPLYKYPYLTGCKMMYTTDVGSIANNFGGRRLENDGGDFDFDNLCAQFCVPHLIERPFYFGLKKYADYAANQGGDVDYSVDYGLCEDGGYSEHIADQTFEYMGYQLDLEVYDTDNQND